MLNEIRRVCSRFCHALLLLKDTKALRGSTPESGFGSLYLQSGGSVSLAVNHSLNLTTPLQPLREPNLTYSFEFKATSDYCHTQDSECHEEHIHHNLNSPGNLQAVPQELLLQPL